MKYSSYSICCFALFALIFLGGCGKNIPVRGKVTFSDGTPLTIGSVCFQSATSLSQGTIQPDGTFILGTEKGGNGVPPDTYKVFISGAFHFETPKERKSEFDPPEDVVSTPLVDRKFLSPHTTELSCNVQRGMKLPFEIVVEAP